MPTDLSSPQVRAALGEIYADLDRAGSQRRAVMAASAKVRDWLPLVKIGEEEFTVRGYGGQKWRWFRAGDNAVEARAQVLGAPAQNRASFWILQWHCIDSPVLALVEDAIVCAGVVPRPNDRLHDLILQLLWGYPVVVGTVAAIVEDDPARQITIHRVLSRSRDPLPVDAIVAAGFSNGDSR